VAFAASQCSGDMVWAIVETLGSSLYGFPCGFTDTRMLIECPGYGGRRNIQLSGNVPYGCFVFTHVLLQTIALI
jgi:hypothetical protein